MPYAKSYRMDSILSEKPFTYIMKSCDPKIDPLNTPHFSHVSGPFLSETYYIHFYTSIWNLQLIRLQVSLTKTRIKTIWKT